MSGWQAIYTPLANPAAEAAAQRMAEGPIKLQICRAYEQARLAGEPDLLLVVATVVYGADAIAALRTAPESFGCFPRPWPGWEHTRREIEMMEVCR